MLAKARGVGALPEIYKHAAVAFVVISVSRAVGLWIQSMTGCT